MIRLTLPYPPSVNHYWRHVGNRVLISKEGRKYRAAVSSLLNRKNVETLTGDLIVDIVVYPPDRRRRDVDNCLKAMLDSMQWGGAYEDDSQIVRLTIEKREPAPKAGNAEVVIQRIPAPIGKAGFRSCLRCDEAFVSTGPGNRICESCTFINDLLPPALPIERGSKRHNGELM